MILSELSFIDQKIPKQNEKNENSESDPKHEESESKSKSDDISKVEEITEGTTQSVEFVSYYHIILLLSLFQFIL